MLILSGLLSLDSVDPFVSQPTTIGGEEMKTASMITKTTWNRLSHWLVVGLLALAGDLAAKPTAEPPENACQQTAAAALSGCKSTAQGSYKTALGRCANLTDPTARGTCEKHAAADLKDALDTCEGGFEVRRTACEKFGPAPYDPEIDPANFVEKINNPYFPLVPGTTFIYKGRADGDVITDNFAVTHVTRVIDGVTCVEVHDSVFTNGVLTEDTRDWFAQDKEGNVWYFGENTAELEDGLLATIAGSFMAGVSYDKPGIIMKAHPVIGDFYRQEFSLNNAEDNAETVGLNATVTVPFGTFQHCLKSAETTPLEPGALEDKFYATDVGNVLTADQVSGERDELIQIITE
jgi:hypothetical protein